MNILFMMMPVAILLGALFVGAFIWAVTKGQYDDAVTPAYRILIEEEDKKEDQL